MLPTNWIERKWKMMLSRYLFPLSIIHPQFDLQLLLKNNSFAFVLSLDGRQNILCFVIPVLLCNIEKDKIFLVSICFGSQSPKIDGIHIEFDSVQWKTEKVRARLQPISLFQWGLAEPEEKYQKKKEKKKKKEGVLVVSCKITQNFYTFNFRFLVSAFCTSKCARV